MKKSRILSIIIFFLILIISSIYISADPLFNWPVNLPKSLSATLGEIRGFSLHQGIDIKTNARSGYPVFAGSTGSVSRIISKNNGYGNAVFLDHGSGMESVYGHLDAFEEAKYHLSTLTRTLKVLYNNDYLDFKLSSRLFRFSKDEKIAFSGESGSGLPHLHFEIRENNQYANPLDYIHIRDTKPPVIQSVYACVENENATIYEQNIKVKKKWGAYRTVYNPVEIEGEKIFFKISCYDMAGAYNHVAVYRIKVYADKKKIFEISFDNLKNSDIQYGKFVYDISKSTIKDGVSYVYVLCKKPGNNFSGINSLNDGYIDISGNNTNQKDIVIAVSDFAGNEETLQFKIARRDTATAGADDFSRVNGKKRTELLNKAKNVRILIPDNAVHSDTLIKVEDPVNPEVIDSLQRSYSISGHELLKLVSIYPHDAVYKKPINISFKKPAGISHDDVKHIQIFHFFEDKKPRALKTNYSKYRSEFTAESYTNGYFALIIDKTPPKIFLPPVFELCEDIEIYRKIRLYTSDNISRINKDSILCIVDGEIYPSIFDDDRKWIEISLPSNAISKGMHHIFAKASDEANNESVFRGLLNFN